MGKTKSDLFTPLQNRVAAMARALAHPARIAILEHLIQKGECVCGDLVEALPLSQSTVSQHLKAMKEAGIVRGNVQGPFSCYCLDEKCCAELSSAVERLFSSLQCKC